MIRKGILKAFKQAVGADNVFSDPADLHTYSYDAALLDPLLPGLAFRSTNAGALSQVVWAMQDISRQYGIEIGTFGHAGDAGMLRNGRKF